MSKKVTIKTLWSILDEIDKGAKDKSRVINDIKDEKVKEIFNNSAKLALNSGFATGAGLSAGISAAGIGATGIGATGIGAIAGGGIGVKSAIVGAKVGSGVPVVGTIIGAAVGLGIGAFITWKISNKEKNEKQRLNQAVMAKQNGIINQLKKEMEELAKENHKTQKQNERYEYIIAQLMAYQDIKNLSAE